MLRCYALTCSCMCLLQDDNSERYGVSYWLWGNDTIKATITDSFNITR